MEKYVIADREAGSGGFRVRASSLGQPIFLEEEEAMEQFRRAVGTYGVENVLLLQLVETSVSVEVRFARKGASSD